MKPLASATAFQPGEIVPGARGEVIDLIALDGLGRLGDPEGADAESRALQRVGRLGPGLRRGGIAKTLQHGARLALEEGQNLALEAVIAEGLPREMGKIDGQAAARNIVRHDTCHGHGVPCLTGRPSWTRGRWRRLILPAPREPTMARQRRKRG